jgi:hypothetical protein
VGADDVVDHSGPPPDLPKRSPPGQLGDDLAFRLSQPERLLGPFELVGRLAEEDLGGGVGEQAGGDLGGGGAVVGLGAEVAGSVGDADVGDAVGPAELEAGLEVGGGVAVGE